MKQRFLIKEIEKRGFYFLRHGSNHDIYTNGKREISVPRHKEVKERTAKEIIKEAEGK